MDPNATDTIAALSPVVAKTTTIVELRREFARLLVNHRSTVKDSALSVIALCEYWIEHSDDEVLHSIAHDAYAREIKVANESVEQYEAAAAHVARAGRSFAQLLSLATEFDLGAIVGGGGVGPASTSSTIRKGGGGRRADVTEVRE